MKVGVLGRSGSIGRRHEANLKSLGIEVDGYDYIERNSTAPAEMVRREVIERCDAVVISTPTAQHLDDLNDAIKAGKHVFVEKPLARAFHGAHGPLVAAKLLNRVVFVGNNLRYHACVKAAKGNLLNGAIGNPIWASITVGQFTTKEPYLLDGVTLNWGAHEIDLALYLLGTASVRSAWTDSGDTVSDFWLDHSSGCRSVVHLDYVTNPEIRATTIVGDKGQMVIDLVARWLCITTVDGKRHELQAQDSWDSNYIDEMKGFLSRCNGLDDGIGATGEDGLATLKIIEAVKNEAKN